MGVSQPEVRSGGRFVATTKYLRYLVVRSCLALENWSDIEADWLYLPEESWSGAVLHNPLHLESQLLTVLHWDGLTRGSWGRREGKLKEYTVLGQPLMYLMNLGHSYTCAVCHLTMHISSESDIKWATLPLCLLTGAFGRNISGRTVAPWAKLWQRHRGNLYAAETTTANNTTDIMNHVTQTFSRFPVSVKYVHNLPALFPVLIASVFAKHSDVELHPFGFVCYVRSQWPLTFEHWNLVGSFLGPNWSLYKIWRNSLKVFLRYYVHKTGTSWATWKNNAPGYTWSQRGAMKIIKGQKPRRILFVNLHSLQLNFKQKVFRINLTRNETGGCFLVRPSTSSNTRLKTDIIRRSYSLSVWTGPRVPYSWKLHDRVRDTVYHLKHHPGETSQTSKFQKMGTSRHDTWWSIVASLCIHQLSPGRLWVQYQCLYHMRDKQTALLLTETRVKEKWLFFKYKALW